MTGSTLSQQCAFGKVVLLGEHAINYGSKALCAALSSSICINAAKGKGRVFAKAQITAHHKTTLKSLGINEELSRLVAIEKTIQQGYKLAMDCYGLSYENELDFYIEFGFAPLLGLGGSAALSVCLAKLAADLQHKAIAQEQQLQAAIKIETMFHGPTSGMDVKTVFYGGIGFIDQAKQFIACPSSHIKLCIGYSGQPKNTKNQVEFIQQSYRNSPTKFQQYMASISQLVDQGIIALQKNNLQQLGNLMTQNHQILKAMGLSTPPIETLCQTALDAGAFGAKLTGAGGGGCVIALVDTFSQQQVSHRWSALGFDFFCDTVLS